MKNKYQLIKFTGIAALILVPPLYILLYFLPTIHSINLLKREAKDLNNNIANYQRIESLFAYPDEREKRAFQAMSQRITQSLAAIHDKQEYVGLFTRVFEWLQQTASQDGITSLVITSNAKELEVNTSPMYSSPQELNSLLGFVSSRILEMEARKKLAGSQSNDQAAVINLTDLNFQTIYLTFSGELGRTLNFLNHIPWGTEYLQPERCLIARGEYSPRFLVVLRVFFRDLRQTDEK